MWTNYLKTSLKFLQNAQYVAEARFGDLSLYFAALAILISSLGLLGLSSYRTTQRTKEIGIRKVLGASVPGIVMMLTREFILLVIIALLIGGPVAFITMNTWLADFAYRIDMPWWAFVISSLIAVFVTFLTISFQTIRSALTNPATILRTE